MSEPNPHFGGYPFYTSSDEKAAELAAILGYEIVRVQLKLPEPEFDRRWNTLMAEACYEDLAALIADQKAKAAYEGNRRRPVVVESTLLFIPELEGYPGPFIGDLDTPEARRVLARQVRESRYPREGHAVAISTLALFLPKTGEQRRRGRLVGRIPKVPSPNESFRWDTIFIPPNETRTFSEMSFAEKNAISMRRLAVNELLAKPFEFAS